MLHRARVTRIGLLALLLAVPASAQVGAPAQRRGISLTPYLGVLVPTKDLLEHQGEITKVSIGILFGGRLGIGIGQRIGIEADVGYSPGSVEIAQGGTTINQDVKVLTGSGRVTLYVIPRTSPLWLALGGGVSAVRHTFENASTGTSDIEPGTNVGGVLGASAGIRLGRIIAFNFGVDDYFYSAKFDVAGNQISDRKQHDFRFTGGVRVPFLGF